MAPQAERANVLKIAFASTFGNRQNVVRIPQAFTSAPPKAPVCEKQLSARSAGTSKLLGCCETIDPAYGTNAAIAQQNLFAKIAWLRPKPPLMHTEFGTEGVPAAWNFERTPSAQTPSIRSARNRLPVDPSPNYIASSAHI